MCMKIFAVLVCAGVSLLATGSASAEDKRCGWLVNLEFRSWWLSDQESKWLISEPDGYEAEGADKMPEISAGEYTKIGDIGNYGYACACVHGITDLDSSQFTQVKWVEMRPMAECEANINLPLPPENADE